MSAHDTRCVRVPKTCAARDENLGSYSFAPKFRFGSNSGAGRPSGSAALPALRARNCPLPGLACSLSSETSTSPRSSTVVGQPFTVRPFQGVKPARSLTVLSWKVTLFFGSQIAISASEPIAIVPFFG